MAGWWAEVHAHFGVTVDPEVGFTYGGPSQEFGVVLAPEVGMSGVARNTAGFGLVLPTLIGMSGGGKSVASFGLTLNPYIAMREPGGFTPLFPSEDLFPSTLLFPTPRSQRPGFGMELSPTLGFSADGVHYAREFEVSVTPSLGMSASERYSAAFDLGFAPQVGMSAAERYTRDFNVTLTPAIGMDAVGHNGLAPVEFDAVSSSAQNTTSVSWSHTATAGATVLVNVVTSGSAPITTATYNGVAMTLLTSRALNNVASNGTLYRYVATGVSGGARTIAISTSGFDWLGGAAASYVNVGSVGTSTVVSGNGTSLSQGPVSVSSGQRVVQSFANSGARAHSSLSGGTNRYNGSGSTFPVITISDASSTATFTATTSSGTWAGIATVLSPA